MIRSCPIIPHMLEEVNVATSEWRLTQPIADLERSFPAPNRLKTVAKMLDIERIRALVVELAALLAVDEAEMRDDLVAVSWFSRETYVTSGQLRGARRRGLIRSERRGSRWYYSRSDVKRLFPDRWSGKGRQRSTKGG